MQSCFVSVDARPLRSRLSPPGGPSRAPSGAPLCVSGSCRRCHNCSWLFSGQPQDVGARSIFRRVRGPVAIDGDRESSVSANGARGSKPTERYGSVAVLRPALGLDGGTSLPPERGVLSQSGAISGNRSTIELPNAEQGGSLNFSSGASFSLNSRHQSRADEGATRGRRAKRADSAHVENLWSFAFKRGCATSVNARLGARASR